MVKVTKLIGLLALGTVVFASAASAETPALVRRIVAFDQNVPPADRLSIAMSSGGKFVRELRLINAVVVELPEAQVRAADAMLKTRPEVLRVNEDPKINWLLDEAKGFAEVPFTDVSLEIEPFSRPPRRPRPPQPKPPVPPEPEKQETPWGIARVSAEAAWAVTRGDGVSVCVVDTGIDMTHPDLKDNIKGGWNAVTKTDDFNDDNGHGSHCSGTIAGVDNAIGVVGVAPKASLYGVKVLDAGGSGTFDDVIAGMQWCVEHKMQVMSMSLGASQGNDSLKAAVEAVAKSGTVLIAAAGNSGPKDNTVGYPAGYEGAIAIAASDSGDKVAYFSSRGKAVSVIAPGVDVKSTYMQGGYDTLSGTSMATPHVAGLTALWIAAKGLSGVDAAREALTKAAASLPNNPPATQQGAGLPDALKLVR